MIVNPLRIPADVVHELEHNMLLCYTGRTRRSDHIIEDQTAALRGAATRRALEGLRMQKALAVEMKDALLRRRLNDFGELLGTAWEDKKKMSPRITTDFIDEAYDAARRRGRARRQGHRRGRRRLHAVLLPLPPQAPRGGARSSRWGAP